MIHRNTWLCLAWIVIVPAFVVTAHKVEEDKQKIPANLTVVDSAALEELGVDKTVTFTELTPNVNIVQIDVHASQ